MTEPFACAHLSTDVHWVLHGVGRAHCALCSAEADVVTLAPPAQIPPVVAEATEPIPVPNARSVVYVVTCAQCNFKAQETFEGITVAGWVMRQNHTGQVESFCPQCVYGLPRA